jgi:hypothetical protein
VAARKSAGKPGKHWRWWTWGLLLAILLVSVGLVVLAAGAAIADLAGHQWSDAIDPAKDAGGGIIGLGVLGYVLVKFGPRGVQEVSSFELTHYSRTTERLRERQIEARYARGRATAAEAAAVHAEQATAVDPANPNPARLAVTARARAAKLAAKAAEAESLLVMYAETLERAEAALDEAYPDKPAS